MLESPILEVYKIDQKAPGASIDAAVAAASATVLVELVPGYKTEIQNRYITALSQIPDGPAKEKGIIQGQKVATRMLALRINDGSERVLPYNQPQKPGIFQPPKGKVAIYTQWPLVKHFILKSGDQFRLVPPPNFQSSEYAKDLNEIKGIGALNSLIRSKEQSEIAHFWNNDILFLWSKIAEKMALRFCGSSIDLARQLALFNFVMADASIAFLDSKYFYNIWRPDQAIRMAKELGNPLITSDPSWQPLLGPSTIPEYPSGHAEIAGALAEVLTTFYGDNVEFDISIDSPTITRHFKSFKQAAEESALSRIYGGMHVRNSTQKGSKQGSEVAQYILIIALKPLDSP